MSDLDSPAAATAAEPAPNVDSLLARIETRSLRIGVIGMGYVGLPLARAFGENGFVTTGFDIDAPKLEKLNAGHSPFRHIPGESIKALATAGRFRATGDFDELRQVDAILICVPTPLTAHHEPDLSFVVSTAEAIAHRLRPGHLVVLESTTYPGTTDEVIRPILERGGLRSGIDFFLAYSPEREDPGNIQFGTTTIPKVVGGDGEGALRLAERLYGSIVGQVVPVSTLATAEAVKLTENIFRSVNIAMVNELKLIYSRMGIDVWEVIDAAKTKPFGYMPFYPGPGLGGHCIPIDPFYLTWKAREYGMATRFIELAGEINRSMPQHVVNCLADALNMRFGKALMGSRILLLGLAYKKNVDDIRESPALRLIELLEERGAAVSFYDPFIAVIPNSREHKKLAGRQRIEWNPDALGAYDAALICTDHDDVDYPTLVERSRLVVDTRNVTRNCVAGRDRIVSA